MKPLAKRLVWWGIVIATLLLALSLLPEYMIVGFHWNR
jgi:hypothetical protein